MTDLHKETDPDPHTVLIKKYLSAPRQEIYIPAMLRELQIEIGEVSMRHAAAVLRRWGWEKTVKQVGLGKTRTVWNLRKNNQPSKGNAYVNKT